MTNKRFERIYEDVDVFCRDHNAKGISQLLEKEDYDKIVDLLNTLHEENQELKAQLLYDGDDVCGICKHEYLAPSGDYFIGKCEKGHEECSKEDIRYCKDFELKGDVE